MRDSITWVGLDDSANKVNGAVFHGDETNPHDQFVVENNESGLRCLVKRLKSCPGEVRCVYEAGVNGYWLQRYLFKNKIHCDIAAPSLTPRRAGKRVKTDRLDAKALGSLYRSRQLTTITIPNKSQESLRDLMRGREDAMEDLQRARHRLSRLLNRQGIRFREGKNWSQAHLRWIQQIRFDDARAQLVIDEYRMALQEEMERLKRFDDAILVLAKSPAYEQRVVCLMALRGIKELTAMTIIAEAIDVKRFRDAPAFMGAIGLVPSEYSSGAKERRGAITKTGNSHMRRVFVESAWHYRWRSVPGKNLRKRRAAVPPEVLQIARKADQRLRKKYWALVDRGKDSRRAAVAVARELAGFVWAIGQVA